MKIPNLGSNANITGYVKCSDISFDYEKYVDPDQQTPNTQIGTNTEVIFNMWYFPNSKYKGVNYATPLYYQFFNGDENSYKCTLLSSISGLYKYKGIYLDPTAYLKEMTAQYWASGGVHTWPATMNTIKIQNGQDKQYLQDEIRKIAKKILVSKCLSLSALAKAK